MRTGVELRRVGWASAVLLVAAVPCGAQVPPRDSAGVVAETFVAAKPIEQRAPSYPREAFVAGPKEGWVDVSFVVSPTGEVVEPMIEDSSGVSVFEREALRTVRRWRYEPATRNGEPVEQSMARVHIAFLLGEQGVSRTFLRKYQRIAALIEGGDFAAAQPLLEQLESAPGRNFYEDAWFWWLKYAYLDGTGSSDTQGKIVALRRALGYQDSIGATKLVIAAQRLFALETQTGDLAESLKTYEFLRESGTAKRSDLYEAAMAQLKPVVEEIEAIIASDNALRSHAEVGTNDYWVRRLLRRFFSMSNVAGRIDVIDVRCRRGTKRYDSFPLNGVWRVPESWGDCGVYIKGEPGTTFDFLEHASPVSATPLSD